MKKRRFAPYVAVIMLTSIVMLGLVTADTSQRFSSHSSLAGKAYSSPRLSPPRIAALSKVTRAANSSQQSDNLLLHIARRGHTATTMADGKVIFIGGEAETGPVAQVEVLDPDTRAISVASNLITPRVNHSATLLPDGRVLVTGGSNTRGAIKATEIFNPETDSFAPGPYLQRARSGHTATTLEDGSILMAGGREDQTAEILDLSQKRFRLLSTRMTISRAFHSAVLLRNGKVLLVGGIGYYNGDTSELFNPKDSSFSAARNWLNVNRVRPNLRILPDGTVQIIGGDERGTMEMFDPAANSIRNYVDLTTTTDIVPSWQMLHAQTRTAFINAAMKQKQNEQSNLSHLPDVGNKVNDQDGQNSAYDAVARANYTHTELEQRNQAVIAGGVDSKGQFLRSVVLLDSSASSVNTDRVEYETGSRPLLSGADWIPNEEILIVRQKAATGERSVLHANADAEGKFTTGELSASSNEIGVYILTAVGQSSTFVAQTAYRIAGAFNPQAKNAYSKPFRVKAMIPVGAEGGTIPTELGPMNWKATPMGNMRFLPEQKIKSRKQGSISPAEMITYTLYTFELPWSGESFPIPLTPLSIENSSGLFTGNIAIELKAVFDPGCLLCGECCAVGVCIPCPVLPSASADAYVLGTFNLHTVNDIAFQGTFVKNDILLFPFIGIEVFIPGTDFKVSATAGLYAGIKLSSDRQVKARTTLDFANLQVKSGVGIGFEFVPPDFHIGPFNKIIPPDSIGGDFEVLDFGDLCAKLSVGPGLNASFSFGDLGVCSPSVGATARIAAFVEGCVTPTTDTPTCEIFNLDISVGAQLDFTAAIKCGIVSKSFSPELEFVDITVKSLGPIYFKDTSAPSVTCPASITRETDPGLCTAVVTYTAPTIADDCTPVTGPACAPASGTAFPKGITTVTCTATDAKTNAGTCNFTVTINDRETPKIAACPASIVKSNDLGQCSAVAVYSTPVATDNCSATVSCTPISGTAFPKGTTTVTCTATDPSGNTDGCSFTVTVNDTEKPGITCPAPITVSTEPDRCSAVVTFVVPASDNCPGVGVPLCVPPSGSIFPKGVTTVSCMVGETSGNTNSCSFTVTVVDTQLPSLTCPNNITITAAAACPLPTQTLVTFTVPTPMDNCPGATASCTPPSGSSFRLGTTIVVCTAVDASGNRKSCSFNVTVFTGCLQDDSVPGSVVLFNHLTGAYQFYSDGVLTAQGSGTVIVRGCTATIQHSLPDRRVVIRADELAMAGSASLQMPAGTNKCLIANKNMRSNTNCTFR